MKTQLVNTDLLGAAFQSETPYENPDASPVTINKDYFGKVRTKGTPFIGPFENLKLGKNKIKVWSN